MMKAANCDDEISPPGEVRAFSLANFDITKYTINAKNAINASNSVPIIVVTLQSPSQNHRYCHTVTDTVTVGITVATAAAPVPTCDGRVMINRAGLFGEIPTR